MDNKNDYAVLRAKARQRATAARNRKKSCAGSLTVMTINVILLKLRVSFFKQISGWLISLAICLMSIIIRLGAVALSLLFMVATWVKKPFARCDFTV